MRKAAKRGGGVAMTCALAAGVALAVSGPAEGAKAKRDKAATAALELLSAGSNTIAGPGTFTEDSNDRGEIYQVVSGAPVDVCITVRNVGAVRVEIKADAEPSVDVRRDTTVARCFGAPQAIELKCNGSRCSAVWRIDRL